MPAPLFSTKVTKKNETMRDPPSVNEKALR